MTSNEFAPTDEQRQAVNLFLTGENLVIKAGAGSGKTSTLRLLADAVPHRKGLYLAFNKAVQVEAARTFGPNIEARTANSMAYQGVPESIRSRIELDRQTYTEQADLLGITKRPSVLGIHVARRDLMMTAISTVAALCIYGDTEIGHDHVSTPRSLKAFSTETYQRPFRDEAVRIANLIWTDATSERGVLKLSHDHLLKQWALSGPVLDYDFILYDEAQDADASALMVVNSQVDSQIVAVGDPAQAIYSWRGSSDSLAAFSGNRTQLSQSWRFGGAIAEEANVWLSALGEDMRLTGNPHRDSVVGRRRSNLPDVVLCRTNGGLINQVIRAQERNIPVALAGKDTARKVKSLAEAAGKLQNNQWQGHPDLIGFKSWAEVRDYVEDDPAGSDIAVLVKLIDLHGPDRLVSAVDTCVSVDKARIAASTAHTAKGLEWDHVRIDEDFPQPRTDKKTQQLIFPDREEMMLAYVAVTRAKHQLDPRGVEWIHDLPGAQQGPEHQDETHPATAADHADAATPAALALVGG